MSLVILAGSVCRQRWSTHLHEEGLKRKGGEESETATKTALLEHVVIKAEQGNGGLWKELSVGLRRDELQPGNMLMQGRLMQERDVRQVWVPGPPFHTSTPPLSPALFPWVFSCFLLLAPLSLLVMSHHSQPYLCKHAVQQFTLSGKLARFYLDLSAYKAVLHKATKTGSFLSHMRMTTRGPRSLSFCLLSYTTSMVCLFFGVYLVNLAEL